MDKIIYTCSAEYMGCSFPKRRFFDIKKKQREVRLEWAETFGEQEVDVCVNIVEDWQETFCLHIPVAFSREIYQAFIDKFSGDRRYEVLLLVDFSGSYFSEIIMENIEDINYLAVLTRNPEVYEKIMETLEYEYGLFGMIFTEYRDFFWYQRQICEKKDALVFMGDCMASDEGGSKKAFLRFPKGSLVLDFDETSSYQKMLNGKRMENDYASIANFLDNIVKNRYNSMVNEGLQDKKNMLTCLQKNISCTDDENKLGGKRKGIKKWKKRKIF